VRERRQVGLEQRLLRPDGRSGREQALVHVRDETSQRTVNVVPAPSTLSR
jgi:hypothetical protein